MKNPISLYLPGFAQTIVYMLQSTEYQIHQYIKWFWRTPNFRNVAKRRQLVMTRAAKLLIAVIVIGQIVEYIFGLWLLVSSYRYGQIALQIVSLIAIIITPILWAHIICIPLLLGRYLITLPKQRRLIAESKVIFKNHKGIKIAVAGSYGKTSMKELITTVLQVGKKVAATPGNKNVSISHALFAKRLDGDEDVLIIEYGEGAPGDVVRFAEITQPDMAVITGIAPAHLDHYASVDDAAKDIFSLQKFVESQDLYVNADSPLALPFIRSNDQRYSYESVSGYSVKDVSVNYEGTKFTIAKDNNELTLHSGLIGRHHVGPLALASILARRLGLSDDQIKTGISATVAYEHRMQLKPLNGAWIIDDTYNGNIEGIRAGLQLLQDLEAKRKWYVSPGLVDQGEETMKVHLKMGELIANANPDKVVLMNNSVTEYIQDGLMKANYNGELTIEDNPLKFYESLEHRVANGDLVLMQNDWTDNYN